MNIETKPTPKRSKLKIKKITTENSNTPRGGWCVHNNDNWYHCCGVDVTIDKYVCWVS